MEGGRARAWDKCVTRWVSERERGLLCSSGILLAWAWDSPGTFTNWPMKFPSFHGLLIGLYLPVRLIGLFDQAPPPVPPNNLVAEWGREGC